MAFPKTKSLMTGAELREMADSARYELVDGELIEMSPTKMEHGRLEFRLAMLLAQFVDEHDLGEVMTGEVGIYIRRNPDTIRAADALFISHERLEQATPDDFLDVAPELIVEIMSPSDRWNAVQKKLRDYFEIGVTAVLLVQPSNETILLYSSPTQLQEFQREDTLTLEAILHGFTLPLAKLFKHRKTS